MPDPFVLLVVVVTYIGLSLGRVPGLALDRTGVAILGAVVLLAAGRISLADAKAAIDLPTLAVLFGMMLLSVQYQLSGLYAAIADRLARTRDPRRLLLGTIVVTAALSAVLTNDVICLALAPLIGGAVMRAGLPPLPYLLGIACASNIGSALTPIGNPQNILIAQHFHLPFGPFVVACIGPVVVSLIALWLLLRRRVPTAAEHSAQQGGELALTIERAPADRWQARKAVVLTAIALGLFLLPVADAAPLTALAVAGVVLTSRRMTTRAQLALVDWPLLMLFVSLFVIMRAVALGGWTTAASDALHASGTDLHAPWIFIPVVTVLSNVVSNVPAVMVLQSFLDLSPRTGHALALVSTFAGNLLLIGSIANLIVAEQAARLGVRISFVEHMKVGVPATLASLGSVVVWWWLSALV
ncbi:MAG: anion transporter [Planctomycetota bacterium]